MAVCEPVWMEVLAGARDERHLKDLRRLLAGATLLATDSTDCEDAAGLYRIFRRNGETPRKLIDCLNAEVAVRHDVTILHGDADFDVLSPHAPQGGASACHGARPSLPVSAWGVRATCSERIRWFSKGLRHRASH